MSAVLRELIIRPYEGVGEIDFDMTPDDVESVLGKPAKKSTYRPGTEAWLYEEPDFQLCFDHDSRCELVEFFEPTTPVVDGIRLFGRWDEVMREFSRRGYSLRENVVRGHSGIVLGMVLPTGAVVCEALGVTVGREIPKQENVQSVNAFRRGYWQGLLGRETTG